MLRRSFASFLLLAAWLTAPLPGLAAPLKRFEIPLPRGAAANPIGVEPEGGRFQKLLEARATPGEYSEEIKFNTDSGRQPTSTLAIYAMKSPVIRQEKPLFRLRVSGLRDGSRTNRVGVRVVVLDARTLGVEARDLSTGSALAVSLFEARGAVNAPPPIASRDGAPGVVPKEATVVAAPGTVPYNIGVRSAGGLMNVVVPVGTKPNTTKFYHIRPRFQDQAAADFSLYYGPSRYMENNKLWGRFIVSGIPPGDAGRRIRIDLAVGPDGKVMPPRATDDTAATGQVLKVQPYSKFAADRLAEAPRPAAPFLSRRIPALPVGG